MKMSRSKIWVALAVLAMAGARPAAAEVARSMVEIEERLKPGTQIDVVDREGRVFRGDFVRADADGLLVALPPETRNIPAGDILTVTKKGDSLKNGMLIGAGIGLGLTLLVESGGDGFCDSGAGDCMKWIASQMAGDAALGAFFDFLVKGNEVVYRAPQDRVSWSVGPVAVRGGAGIRLAVRF